VNNALSRDNAALQQKISSVTLDLSKDINTFKDFVKREILRQQKTAIFKEG
jgi:hypothetical protein